MAGVQSHTDLKALTPVKEVARPTTAGIASTFGQSEAPTAALSGAPASA